MSRGVKITGTIILAWNLILDCVYILKSAFAGKGYFSVYGILLIIRLMIPVIGIFRYCIYKISNPESKLDETEFE